MAAQIGQRRGKAWIVATLAGALAVAGCAVGPEITRRPEPSPATGKPDPVVITQAPEAQPAPRDAALAFVQVIRSMEPAVERECVQRRRSPINCDFQFVVDDRVGLEPNAFQTLDQQGRPIIGFTLSLLAAARNADELAFVVGHEASHHILGHIDQKTSAATAGAVLMSSIAAASGGDAVAIKTAQRWGAQMGARYYSKEWELQADYLGAIIALNAGYDAEHGAQFFARIPDPGNRVLGTHPSRAQRQETVARATDDRRAGRIR